MEMKQRQIGGLAGWILARIRRTPRSAARLILHERITVGPRQHLALVEADGRRFLIATGADGAPSFLALDANWLGRKSIRRRVSW
ncbi:MAG: hypothetical protein ACLGSD_06820 [Acidobacteriota bacterium]